MPNPQSSGYWWRDLRPGESQREYWKIEGILRGELDLPVLAARGTQPGPTLLITAAVHGDEYEGPAAIAALFDQIAVSGLRGSVIALPVVNGAAWQARSRVSPTDGIDMNRVFGARDDRQTDTERLAEIVFDTFVADREHGCDTLIDLHSGGAALLHLPLIGWYDGGSIAEEMARRFDPALHPWRIPDVPGVLSYEAHRLDRTALGAEWGGGAQLDPSGVSGYVRGLLHSLRYLEMLPASPDEPTVSPDARPPIAGDYQSVTHGGLFVPRVALMDAIPVGAVLGTVHDPLGNLVEEVLAARAGTVAGIAARPLLRPGERVAYIG